MMVIRMIFVCWWKTFEFGLVLWQLGYFKDIRPVKNLFSSTWSDDSTIQFVKKYSHLQTRTRFCVVVALYFLVFLLLVFLCGSFWLPISYLVTISLLVQWLFGLAYCTRVWSLASFFGVLKGLAEFWWNAVDLYCIDVALCTCGNGVAAFTTELQTFLPCIFAAQTVDCL